jgi:hypothetical protein
LTVDLQSCEMITGENLEDSIIRLREVSEAEVDAHESKAEEDSEPLRGRGTDLKFTRK